MALLLRGAVGTTARHFTERIKEVMILRAITEEALARRKAAFMNLWEEMCPIIEGELGMTYQEMENIV